MQYSTREDDFPIVISYESEILKNLPTAPPKTSQQEFGICSSWWRVVLVLLGSCSCLVSPYVPLVALAAIASRTLPLTVAVSSITWLWSIDRLYDYIARHQTCDLNWWIWGGTLGFTALSIVGFSHWISRRISRKGQPAISDRYFGIAFSFMSGFFLFQGFLFLTSDWIGQNSTTIDVLKSIFFQEILWAIGLSGLHYFLVEIALPEIGKCFMGGPISSAVSTSHPRGIGSFAGRIPSRF